MHKIFASLIILSFAIQGFAVDGLDRLMEGNQRFANDAPEHPNMTSERRLAVSSKQMPFAVIVACSDSRVPPEIIFDQGVGDIFVVRVAGNVVGPLELDSIEYGVLYLGASQIIVLGHENCGAVDAVLQNMTKDIESVARLIQPAVDEIKATQASDPLIAAIKQNALNMRDYLLDTPIIHNLSVAQKLEVNAGYYNLQTGVVELLK